MRQNSILHGNIYKNIMMFFLPIWFGTFFQQLYNTADAVIVGNYVGKEALAAVGGPTSTIINLMVGFFVGLSAGATVVIAQYFGSQNVDKTRRGIHTSIAIAIVGGIILMVIGIPLSPVFLRAIGTPEDIFAYSVTYMRIFFCGSIFNLIYNIGSGILRAMGDSRNPLFFLIVASIINIVLDVVLVVFFGMGVVGVGIATVISQVVSSILVLTALKRLPFEICLEFADVKLEKEMLGEIFKIGIPSALQAIMFSLSNIIIMSSINSFGTDTVAAWTAYGKLDGIYWMTMSSFGVATTTFVSQNFGAKNFKRMRESVKACNTIALTTAIAMTAILMVFYKPMFRIFTNDARVIEIGAIMVKIMAPAYFTFVFIENLSGAMRGVGDSIIPTIITIMGICVFRVIWILIVLPINNTLEMALFSYPVSWVRTAVTFMVYYKFGTWFKRSCAKKGFVEETL